jgi:hypothetical protein
LQEVDSTNYSIHLGNINKDSGSLSDTFDIANIGGSGLNSTWTDLLDGAFSTSGLPTGFSTSGSNFSNLAADGSSQFNGYSFHLNTASMSNGAFSASVDLGLTGYDSAGYSGSVGTIAINITGNIVSSSSVASAAVPEPGILWLFGSAGLAGLVTLRRAVAQKTG